jgi:2-polyprenyl-3-methyl-5-hydroxy-6-metoxy-1,4-benzoquinol methylase
MTEIAEKWSKGVPSELKFWQDWFQTKGGQWKEEYRARLDPKTPFNKAVENAIRHTDSRELEILDVGAGPITSLGYVSEKFDVRITATDALADLYSIVMQQAGVTPPVRTQKCFAEKLLDQFGSRRFHVCHSRNALDHCVDPRSAILAMVQLLRPNGLMYVTVFENEAENARYSGLHSWNFDADENNNFILWRGAEKYNIGEDVSNFAEWQLSDHGHDLIFTAYRNAD